MEYSPPPKPSLTVAVKAGRNLKLVNRMTASSDPFCRVGFFVPDFQDKSKVKGWISQQLRTQPKLSYVNNTTVASRTLQPTWGGRANTFTFEPPPVRDCIPMGMRVEVWSKGRSGKDEFMGQVVLTPQEYARTFESWHTLTARPGKNERVTGEILLAITATNMTTTSRDSMAPEAGYGRPPSVPARPHSTAQNPGQVSATGPAPAAAPGMFSSFFGGGSSAAPQPGTEMGEMGEQPAQPSGVFSAFSFTQTDASEPPEFDPYAHQPLKVRLRRKFRELEISKKVAVAFGAVSAGAFLLGLLCALLPFMNWAWTVLFFIFAIVFGLAAAFAWLFKEVYKSMIPAEQKGQLNVVLLGQT